jgi:putative hydrolase of HD superfamily
MGYALRGVADAESFAEHSFHVATLVWLLAREEPRVDALRALELALIHDLAEVRTGDLPMTAGRYLPEGAKATGERAAFDELLAPMGGHARDLLDELAEAASEEARFVKACDKLQLMLKVAVYERWGAAGLGEFWDNDGNFRTGDFETVDRLYSEIRKRRNPGSS